MRSLCATGLVLFASFALAVTAAHAQYPQSGGYGSLTTLPPVGYVTPGAQQVAYNAQQSAYVAGSFGSAFSTHYQDPAAVPAPMPTPQPQSFNEALHAPGDCWDDNWGSCGVGCGGCCGARWFGALGAIAMGRNRANPYWTTFETNNNVNQLLNTQHAGANWAPGGEVTVGYNWCPCGPGIAFTYWGLGEMEGFANIRDPGNNLSTPINLQTQTGDVLIGARPASDFFDNSREHRIQRNDLINNFELNLLTANLMTGRLQIVALAGFRYFRFDERLSFGATAAGVEFGTLGGDDEAYLNFECVNNLFGGQFGAMFNYMVSDRVGVFLTPKVGIFGNQMNCNTHLFAMNGDQGFNIAADKSDVSMMGELNTGISYAFTPSARFYIGYRVLGVAGLALADNQFLPFLADTAGFAQVKQNGSLILHGAMAGVAWSF